MVAAIEMMTTSDILRVSTYLLSSQPVELELMEKKGFKDYLLVIQLGNKMFRTHYNQK